MHDPQKVLGWSAIAIMFIAFIAIFSRGMSSLGAIFGDREFQFEFDKSRLPLCSGIITAITVLSFIYSYIVIPQIGLAIQFGLSIGVFGGIACIIAVAYVPKRK